MITPESPVARPVVEHFDATRLFSIMRKWLELSRGEGELLNIGVIYLGHAYGEQVTPGLINEVRPDIYGAALKTYMSKGHPRPEGETREQSMKKVGSLIDASLYNLGTVVKPPITNIVKPERMAYGLIRADMKGLARAKEGRSKLVFSSNIVNFGIIGRETGFAEIDHVMGLGTGFLLDCITLGNGNGLLSRVEPQVEAVVQAHIEARPQDEPDFWRARHIAI